MTGILGSGEKEKTEKLNIHQNHETGHLLNRVEMNTNETKGSNIIKELCVDNNEQENIIDQTVTDRNDTKI